jgi:hypothetical protein
MENRLVNSSEVVSHKFQPPLHPGYFWYTFALKADYTPGLQCGRKNYVG